ncbi:MAG: flavodoxin family protein [Candidatus Thermoplasmatota archaeon]|jgi:multimeric flavodoxin WrbA|nr:flavodoxin family protein [Candidatus Thermoplasmatota archaeon]
MKVIGINGSARRDGNTAILMEEVFKVLRSNSIETELVQLSGIDIKGCTDCGTCFKMKNSRCAIEDDCVNNIIERLKGADGIILGSPVYMANVTPSMKALMDRVGRVSKANDSLLKRKIGAAVVAVRRAGGMTTFNALMDFLLVMQMIVPGSSYWNIGVGRDPGDVRDDAEGMETMRVLGENMAWTLDVLRSYKDIPYTLESGSSV